MAGDARPLVTVHPHEGETPADGSHAVPLHDVVNAAIRPEVSENKRQPYAVSERAGNQTSAESGRAVSRIPCLPGGGASHRAEEVPRLPFLISESAEGVDKTSSAIKGLKQIGASADAEKEDSHSVLPDEGKLRNRSDFSCGPHVVYGSMAVKAGAMLATGHAGFETPNLHENSSYIPTEASEGQKPFLSALSESLDTTKAVTELTCLVNDTKIAHAVDLLGQKVNFKKGKQPAEADATTNVGRVPALPIISSGDGDGNGDASDDNDNEVSKKLEELWKLKEYAYFDINIMLGGPIIKDYELTVEHVLAFIDDNSLDAGNIRDIVYAVLIIKLLRTGLLIVNTEGPVVVKEREAGLVSPTKITMAEPLAKMMSIVALHAFSHGSSKDITPWYSSFCAVKGTFLSESRFSQVAKLIICSQNFPEIMNMITIGDIERTANVFKYRLSRLSTPCLVRTALEIMPYDVVLEKLNPFELDAYMKFEKAGLIAQIAAGPLSPYCKGPIDPYHPGKDAAAAPLSALKAIPEAPYYPATIRKARIILEEANFNFGKWYQGDKAMKTISAEDLLFRKLARTVDRNMRDAASGADVKRIDFARYATITSSNNLENVKEVTRKWV